MTNKLPEFKGKPLIEIPSFIPSTNFLEGDFGKAVNAEVQGKYGKYDSISVVKYNPKTGIVEGSTVPYCVAVNEFISQEGLRRTASQSDLERVLKTNALPLRGQYEDSALVLRTEDNPNEYLAKSLMAQIKARNPKAKMPAMIPLYELDLVADKNSPYKLGLKLKDSVHVFDNLSVLNKDGNFFSEDIDEKTGLPKKVRSNGNRYLYTRNSGLSRLYLDRSLDAGSDYESLAGSFDDGRVVVVSAEGTAKNFEAYVSQLKQEADKQKAEVDTRFNQAMSLLSGKK